jgi:hypothetical protein
MKLLFINHDSVLCLNNNLGSRYKKQIKYKDRKYYDTIHDIPVAYRFDDFNKNCVSALNDLSKEINFDIVVTSPWQRLCTLEEMQLYYELQGVGKKPIAFCDGPEHDGGQSILNFIETYRDVDGWVSVSAVRPNTFAVADFNFLLSKEPHGGFSNQNLLNSVRWFLNGKV